MDKFQHSLPLKAVLFDMDGTLNDTETVGPALFAQICEEEGLVFSHEDAALFEQVWRRTHPELEFNQFCGFFLRHAGREDETETFVNNYFLRYQEAVANALELKGATKLIEQLSKKYRLAVVTGSTRNQLNAVLAKKDWAKYFEVTVAFEEYGLAKPNPAGYLFVLDELGVVADECIAVEDATVGIHAALGAGLRVVAVREGNPFQDQSEATLRVDSLEQVESVL